MDEQRPFMYGPCSPPWCTTDSKLEQREHQSNTLNPKSGANLNSFLVVRVVSIRILCVPESPCEGGSHCSAAIRKILRTRSATEV